MPLTVLSFATYRTSLGNWRGVDHDAHDFVDAIKGRYIDHYSSLRVRGGWHRFDNLNREDVVRWFGQMVADHLQEVGLIWPLVLVPVPSSKSDVSFRGVNRTTVVAEAIAAACGNGVAVADVLRFDKPRLSACVYRGTRDPAKIYERLRMVGSVERQRVVLVDDVIASGGHLRACAAMLMVDGGADSVLLAVCAGRADDACVADPFAIRRDELHDLAVLTQARRSRSEQVSLLEAEVPVVAHDDVVVEANT